MTYKLRNRDGTISVYGFACGYCELKEFDRDNRVVLARDSACYCVKGLLDGNRFWHTFPLNRLQDARECARNLRQQMRYQLALADMKRKGKLDQ